MIPTRPTCRSRVLPIPWAPGRRSPAAVIMRPRCGRYTGDQRAAMLAKILAALAIPVIVVVAVGAILRATHHTAIPPLTISVTPAAHSSVAYQGATQGQLNTCAGIIATPFTGIAVQHTPA